MLTRIPKAIAAASIAIILQTNGVSSFSSAPSTFAVHPTSTFADSASGPLSTSSRVYHSHSTVHPQTRLLTPTSTSTQLHALSEDEERELKAVQEESRVKVLSDRRRTIRGILKAAESQKNYRIKNGYIPELDPETGKPIKSDAQSALTLTAFVVAGGAVLLRIGGRAALVSALGLDFATDNPELKDGLENVLQYASTMGTESELALFILAWTAVKVFCFDAGGVVLALASGILFGGVWQGAVVSAFAATVGSSVAFGLAKLDTPVRKKALEVVDEYPSLRGIEKVVAKDGIKAIVTLRLAPVLPIPIGLYNYVYGVTNVPYLDFAGGIFLGSLKPYLLDSYLGVFGKQIVDGTSQSGGTEDALLLVALGVSVLIGVFASQLAGETFESINEEIEKEKAEKSALEENGEEVDDGIMREFMGTRLPQWIVGFQLALQAADERVNAMIDDEYEAKVWNYTLADLETPQNDAINPALQPGSPEVVGANTGFDFGASTCDGLVLSPALLSAYFTYADPLYTDEEKETKRASNGAAGKKITMESSTLDDVKEIGATSDYKEQIAASPDSTTEMGGSDISAQPQQKQKVTRDVSLEDLLVALSALRSKLQSDLDSL